MFSTGASSITVCMTNYIFKYVTRYMQATTERPEHANRIVSILIWYNMTYMKKFRGNATTKGSMAAHVYVGPGQEGPSRFKRSFIKAFDTEQFESMVPFMDRQCFREDVSSLLIGRDVVYIKMPIVKKFLDRV